MNTNLFRGLAPAMLLATVLTTSAALAVCSSAGAQPFLIDQSADVLASPQFILLSGGVGQEFRPTLSALDFVQLRLGSMNSFDSGTFRVRIHENVFAGNVVGTSQLLSLTLPGTPQEVLFTFPAPVPLTPGNTYVMEIAEIPGGPFWGVFNGQSDYAGGRLINVASPQGTPEDFDIWFREGVLVPEPGGWSLGLLGAMMLGLWRRIGRRAD